MVDGETLRGAAEAAVPRWNEVSWHIDTADALPALTGPALGTAALGLLEARLPLVRLPAPEGPIHVLAWHADAAPSADDAARLLRTSDAAVAMLTMRETASAFGGIEAIASTASRLGAGHAVAVINVAATESRRLAVGTVGLVSPHVLFKLGLERLPAVPGLTGSPCAVLGQMEIDNVNVTFASVALPSLEGPLQRAWQMEALLDRIDAYDRYLPVLIGGDMATVALTSEDQLRRPAGPEPMFSLLRKRGYDWRACNLPLAATGRRHGLKRLWFFSRGLACDEPAVVPALDGAGEPMGSHDAITLRIRPG